MTSEAPKLLKARQRHTQYYVLLLVAIVLVTQPMLHGSFLRALMFWAGYCLTFIGAGGRAYCSAYLGGMKNKVVMRDGPFGIVRNPLYVFSFIATAGVGLISGMWTFFALLIGAFMVYYPKVVAKEEAFLAHKFGEDYVNYTREVPRWIPDFKKWKEPEVMETQPKHIRKTMMDASVFLLPMPCLSIIHSLQAQHILPVWLTLP